ncbi:MAG: preprotein translocase subunit SecG [Anaerotignum sp.]|nr:preprotein translocase subunit SecG [Anaerotignum sp.]
MMIQEVFCMSTIGTVLTVILIVLAVVLATIILMQSKRSAGLGAVSGNSNTDSFWSKNKGNSVEGQMEKYTKILGAAFMIIAFIVNLVG